MLQPSKSPSGEVQSADNLSASRQAALHDASLVRRFNAGDGTAFVEIMARHRKQMYMLAFSLLKNRADAEEIEQDTFIRAHRGLSRFRGDSSLTTWLSRIAVNLSRNRYWYLFRRHYHQSCSFDSPLSAGSPSTYADVLATDAPSPAREAVNREFLKLVRSRMRRLDATQRRILTLRILMNRSYREIACELGINVGTVKSRIARARASLSGSLADICTDFGPNVGNAAWFESSRPAEGVRLACAQ